MMLTMRTPVIAGGLMLVALLAVPDARAQADDVPCALGVGPDGACKGAPSPLVPSRLRPNPWDSATRVESDPLWEGAMVGGAVGMGYGVVSALVSDCPVGRDRARCTRDRAVLVAVSAALGATIGVGVDAMLRPELTGAHLPGPPASERRIGEMPPSSRGAGVKFKLAW